MKHLFDVVGVIRNKDHVALQVKILVDNSLFVFIWKDGKITQVAGGPINGPEATKMKKIVNGIFYSSFIRSKRGI